jgi:hypothetical protein
MARFPLLIKISNLLAFIFLVGANVYSGLGPEKDDSPYHENHPTYITPAPFVFGVLGLIQFLLGGFVIYQFFSSNPEVVVDGISWHFIGVILLNSLWLFLWQTDHLILAWIVVLITSSQISYIYYTIKYKYPGGSLNEIIWVHAPFSLYHAWIFVMAVISTFAAFLPDKEDDESPSILIKILVVVGLLILEGTAVGYIEKFKGDIAGAVVIAWTLYGIFVEQEDPVIHWSALILAIFTSFHILRPLYRKYVRGDSGESAPLLP